MPYGLTVRRFVVPRLVAPTLIALLAVAWLSAAAAPAQAQRSTPLSDAQSAANKVVLERARDLDRDDPIRATDRIATGKLGDCRRVTLRAYRCAARYEVRTYSLTEATKRRTCTETVAVACGRVSIVPSGGVVPSGENRSAKS